MMARSCARIAAAALVAITAQGCAQSSITIPPSSAVAHTEAPATDVESTEEAPVTEASSSTIASTTTATTQPSVLVDPSTIGQPWGHSVQGVLTFRGNPTRSYYGTGPIPTNPKVLWRYPANGVKMCGPSAEYGITRVWCGTGWTGQPAVFERKGRTWV
ncbi:MAG: hypothetical protein F2735_04565, partial [Actinobacteria bacterium]|nr:hypothetical protein [Actinomycetota bacterium]